MRALSVDPRGVWSVRQARKVLEIIQPEAKEMGLIFQMVEVTCHNDASAKVLLVAYCIRHECAVAIDSACELCLHETHVNRA